MMPIWVPMSDKTEKMIHIEWSAEISKVAYFL